MEQETRAKVKDYRGIALQDIGSTQTEIESIKSQRACQIEDSISKILAQHVGESAQS